MPIRYPCIICERTVKNNQNALLCVICSSWCHLSCNTSNQSAFESDSDWICDVCAFKELPFDDNEHQGNSDFSYTDPDASIIINGSSNNIDTTESDIEEEIKQISNYKGLKLIHLNCTSVMKNIDELRILHAKTQPDIFALSETHISDLIHDSELKISGYNIVRKDRDRHGGGVAAYIKTDLNYVIREDLTENGLELLTVELQFSHMKNVICIVWYRPPNSGVQVFEKFRNVLQKLDDMNCDYVILGDINCNMQPETRSWQTNKLLEIVDSFNLSQIIDTPTRVTKDTASILDLIITNRHEKIDKSGVLPISMSDHYLVYCTWGKKRNTKQNSCHKYKLLRDFKHFDVNAYIADVKQINWDDIQQCKDMNNAYDTFIERLMVITEKHAPLKKRRIRKQESPWMTSEILDFIRERNFQKKKAIKYKKDDDWTEYKCLRNQVTKKIRKAKADFIVKSVEVSKGNSKQIWKSLKTLMPSKKDNENNIVIEDHNGILQNREEIANRFNNFFVDIGVSIQEQRCENYNYDDHEQFVHITPATFRLQSVSDQNVREVLMTIPDKKACGNDNLSVTLLKPVVEFILKPLVYLINLSLTTGEVPLSLKSARVIPIYKSGKRTDMTNYRPISILPVITKIVEKLVFNQLYTFLNDNNIINVNQSGFRPHHSTLSALLNVTEDWLHSMDKGEMIGMVTIDLQKAFDTVDHSVLLNKLRLNGLDQHACKWFRNYLSNRAQFTVVNGVQSSPQIIKCGVPQGSNLGPLLFLIFINDLPNCLKNCVVSLYADDTCIYYASNTVQDIENYLNQDLRNISDWLSCNRLALNTKKCETMLIGSKKRIRGKNVDVFIDNKKLNQVTVCKYLGVYLDNSLDWDKHVKHLCKSTVKNLYLLKRIRHCISQKTALLFYKSIAQSKLDYCDVVWNNMKKQNIKKLQILQNRLLKTVIRVENRYSTRLLYENLCLDTLVERRKNHVLCIMYKIADQSTPDYLLSKFNFKYTSYSLRNAPRIFTLPRIKTCFKKKSLSYYGAKLWNELPVETKYKQTYYTFKSSL